MSPWLDSLTIKNCQLVKDKTVKSVTRVSLHINSSWMLKTWSYNKTLTISDLTCFPFFFTYEKIILWNVFLLYWWLKQKPYNIKNNFLVQAFGLVSFHRYFESEGHYDENMSLDSCSVSHCVRTNQTSVAFTGTDELYHTVICNIRPCYVLS